MLLTTYLRVYIFLYVFFYSYFMTTYLFIDEIGDLGLKGSKYIVLSCLITSDPAPLKRIIKNMRRYKFRKQLSKVCEIKSSNSKPDLIRHVLSKLNELENVSTHFIVLEKGKMYSDYLKSNSHKLYNYVAGKLAYNLVLDDADVVVRINKSKGKQLLRDDFNAYFSTKLHEKSSIEKISIYHSYSHSWDGLQFADVLSWSCFQKFEHRDASFLDLIDLEKRTINLVF